MKFKVYTIVLEAGKSNINELSKCFGISMVQLKTIVSELRTMGS